MVPFTIYSFMRSPCTVQPAWSYCDALGGAAAEKHLKNNLSLDKFSTRLYDTTTNQRRRRVASEGTAKGAAESGTVARKPEVNGLPRALRKRKSVGSDGQPLPLSRRRVLRCTRQSVLPVGSKAEWHHGNSASAHRQTVRWGVFHITKCISKMKGRYSP